jgi:predicted signal transduction protein with EAL and GGDEF domain
MDTAFSNASRLLALPVGADAETLLKSADIALFHAKSHDRSNHQFFEPDMSARAAV